MNRTSTESLAIPVTNADSHLDYILSHDRAGRCSKSYIFSALVKKKTGPHHPIKCHWGLGFSLGKKTVIFCYFLCLYETLLHMLHADMTTMETNKYDSVKTSHQQNKSNVKKPHVLYDITMIIITIHTPL